MFKENLRHAQEWLDGRGENGILYRRALTISDSHRRQTGQPIKTAFDLIEKLSWEGSP